MATDEADVARAEFDALRSELLARAQAQSGLFATALTILAAISGFALAGETGRTEMLLVLPLVLSGLAISLIDSIQSTRRIADYIRDHLWERLPTTPSASFPSWEHYISEFRKANQMRPSVYLASGTLPVVLIFVAPSIASLTITGQEWDSDLAPLWWAGVLSLLTLLAVAMSLLRPPKTPTSERQDHSEARPP
jgi:hypothetical protein